MKRADVLLFESGLAKSRTAAAAMITAGRVSRDGKTVAKPSEMFEDGTGFSVSPVGVEYVSRGGYKLAHALDVFGADVTGLTALDIGASSGGFTDCLLRRGAARVYAVDVGEGQLDASLKNDARVISREKVNARTLTAAFFPEKIDIIVMDVSFISQTLIYPAVSDILRGGGRLISLVKPQFEVGRGGVGHGGIVRDADKKLPAILDKLSSAAAENKMRLADTAVSPVKGGDGNTEYLALFDRLTDV